MNRKEVHINPNKGVAKLVYIFNGKNLVASKVKVRVGQSNEDIGELLLWKRQRNIDVAIKQRQLRFERIKGIKSKKNI